ncbi:MAG: tetratricopeptide repeat protein [Bacteroidales bacterium]|nr:tetratricopeptide repeat protein [Bacteroidales bacterium]
MKFLYIHALGCILWAGCLSCDVSGSSLKAMHLPPYDQPDRDINKAVEYGELVVTPLADSLRNRLRHERTDTGKLMLYNMLAREIGNTTQATSVSDRVTRYNQALQYADSGLTLAREINFRKGEAELYRTAGAMYFYLNDFDSAISNYNQALAITSEIRDEYGQAALMYNISLIYRQQGKNVQALKHSFMAASYWEKAGLKTQMQMTFSHIANLYHQVGEEDLCIKFTKKALEIAVELNDTLRQASLYDILANSCIAKGDTLPGIEAFEKSIGLYRAKPNVASEARVIFNYATKVKSIPVDRRKKMIALSCRYFEQYDPEHHNLAILYQESAYLNQAAGKPDSARHDMDKAVSQALLSGHTATISDVYLRAAQFYLANDEPEQAETCFRDALRYNGQVGTAATEQAVYDGLAEIYHLRGDDMSAYRLKRKSIRVQDSIAAVESRNRLELLQLEYEIKEQQDRQEAEWKAQVKQQQQLIDRHRRRIFMILFATAFLAVLLRIIIRSRRRTRHNNARLQEQHEEILQIQEELRQSTDELSMYKEYLEEMVRTQTVEQADKEQQLRHLSDNLPGFIYRKVTRSDGSEYISFISNMAEQLVGVSAGAIIKKGSLMPLIGDQATVDELKEKEKESIRTMTPFSFEHHFTDHHRQAWLYHSALPHPGKNGDIVWDGFVIDITRQKEVEMSLEKAKEQAEESDRLKSTFLSNMSHEVRTPMNAILGFIGFIEREDVPAAKRSKYIRIVHESIDQLLHLIKNIIDISKLDVRQVVVYPTHFALDPLMEEIRQHWEKYLGERKPLSIILDDSRSIHPLALFNDRERLQQVLSNLIENAVKYTDKGFIRFGCEPADDPSELLFFVEDTGVGIPKNQQGVIFEYFRQGNPESKMRGGTGLGLSISKGLVEGMGGRIWVESVEGQGSIFFFTIRKELQNIQDDRNT